MPCCPYWLLLKNRADVTYEGTGGGACPQPATPAWRAPSPRNCVEIEVDGQPQRGENQRAENARLLPQWTARFDIEGISWLQNGIREPLQHAGIARPCEARAERLRDPRCRRALDTGCVRRNRRAHSRGECRLLGVTVTKDNPWAAVYVDLVNTFYGRAQIPVGMVKGSGVTPENSKMIQAPVERRSVDGTLVYPRRRASGAGAVEAVALLRRLLAAAQDGTVVIVQVGFSTNLARLLDAPADVELVKRKVK